MRKSSGESLKGIRKVREELEAILRRKEKKFG
jgi:hypothetical protein